MWIIFKNITKTSKKNNNKLIIESQQRFRSEKNNVFTKKVKKIALNFQDDRRMQSIHSMETYA